VSRGQGIKQGEDCAKDEVNRRGGREGI